MDNRGHLRVNAEHLDNPRLMCQDLDSGLAKWFASRLDAQKTVRTYHSMSYRELMYTDLPIKLNTSVELVPAARY